MEIPARPSKSSNPWYEAREAYDEAIENVLDTTYKIRGRIPEGSDLNDFYGPDYRGIWWFAHSDEFENAPFNSSTGGVFEVITEGSTGTTATKQVYTNHNSSYWREALVAGDGSWGDWHKYVSEQDLDEKTALPARGNISDGSDLDDFYGPDYKGIWRFAGSTQMVNAPFNSSTSGVLEIISEGITGENATKQVYTNQNSSYWREANTATLGLWGDWHKYASDGDTSHINVTHTVRADKAVSNYVSGEPVYSKDSSSLDRPASITKMFTLLLAFREFNNAAKREQEVTVRHSDPTPGGSGSGSPFEVGDVLTILDLMYLTLLSSHNQASSILGRAIGESINPQTGDPYAFFIDHMNSEAASMGLDGAVFETPSGLGLDNRMSPDQIVTVMESLYDLGAEPRSILATQATTINVGGPNARERHITHSVNPDGDVKFPEMLFAKTGAHGDYACLAMCWENSDGSVGYAALLGSDRANRYRDLRQIINYAKEVPDKQYLIS